MHTATTAGGPPLLLLLLCCTAISVNALPTSLGYQEMESDDTRQVLGSSVVTSVSVITDHGNGSQTIYTDSTGRPVPKPVEPTNLSSPPSLMSPDRYEFYTFNDAGDLVKRLMTLEEIQSLIAGESVEIGSDLPGIDPQEMDHVEERPPAFFFLPRPMEQSQDWSPPAVDKVVAKVQNVLAAMRNSTVENENEPTWSILPMNKIKDTFSTSNPIPTEVIPGSQSGILMTTANLQKLSTTAIPPKVSTASVPITTHQISNQYADTSADGIDTTAQEENTISSSSSRYPVTSAPVMRPTIKTPTESIPVVTSIDAILTKNPTESIPIKSSTSTMPVKNPTDAIPTRKPTVATPIETTSGTIEPFINLDVTTLASVILTDKPIESSTSSNLITDKDSATVSSIQYPSTAQIINDIISRITAPTTERPAIATEPTVVKPTVAASVSETTTKKQTVKETETTIPHVIIASSDQTTTPQTPSLPAEKPITSTPLPIKLTTTPEPVTVEEITEPSKPVSLTTEKIITQAVTTSTPTKKPVPTSSLVPEVPTNEPTMSTATTSTKKPVPISSLAPEIPTSWPTTSTATTSKPFAATKKPVPISPLVPEVPTNWPTMSGSFITFTVPKFTTPSSVTKRPQNVTNLTKPLSTFTNNALESEAPVKPAVIFNPATSTASPKTTTTVKPQVTTQNAVTSGDKNTVNVVSKNPQTPTVLGLTTNKIPSISSTTVSNFGTTSRIDMIPTTQKSQITTSTRISVTTAPAMLVNKTKISTTTSTSKPASKITTVSPMSLMSSTVKIVDQTDNLDKNEPAIPSDSLVIYDYDNQYSLVKPTDFEQDLPENIDLSFDGTEEISTSKTAEIELTSEYAPTEGSVSNVYVPTKISEPPTKFVPVKVSKPMSSQSTEDQALLDLLQEITAEISSEDMGSYESTEDPNKPDLLNVPFISAISAENYDNTDDIEMLPSLSDVTTDSIKNKPSVTMEQVATKLPQVPLVLPINNKPEGVQAPVNDEIMYIHTNTGTFDRIPIKIPSIIIDTPQISTNKIEVVTKPSVFGIKNTTNTLQTTQKPMKEQSLDVNIEIPGQPMLVNVEKLTTKLPSSSTKPSTQKNTVSANTPPTFPSTSPSSILSGSFEKLTTILMNPINNQPSKAPTVTSKPAIVMKPTQSSQEDTSSESYERITTLMPYNEKHPNWPVNSMIKVPTIQTSSESSLESNADIVYEKITTITPFNNQKPNVVSNNVIKPSVIATVPESSEESGSNESYEKLTTLVLSNNKAPIKVNTTPKPDSSEEEDNSNSDESLEKITTKKPMNNNNKIPLTATTKPVVSAQLDDKESNSFELISSTEMSVKTSVSHSTAVKLQTVSKPAATTEKINTVRPSISVLPPQDLNTNIKVSETSPPLFPSETLPQKEKPSFESLMMEAIKPGFMNSQNNNYNDELLSNLGIITFPLSLSQAEMNDIVSATKIPAVIKSTTTTQKPVVKPIISVSSTRKPEITTENLVKTTSFIPITDSKLTTPSFTINKVSTPESMFTSEYDITTSPYYSESYEESDENKNQLEFSSENSVDSNIIGVDIETGEFITESIPDLEVSWQEPPEVVWTMKPIPMQPRPGVETISSSTKMPEKTSKSPSSTTGYMKPQGIPSSTTAKPQSNANTVSSVKINSTKIDANKTLESVVINKNKPVNTTKVEIVKDKTPPPVKIVETQKPAAANSETNYFAATTVGRKPAPTSDRVKVTMTGESTSYTKSETTGEDMELLSSSNPEPPKQSTPPVAPATQETYYTPEVILEPAPSNNLGLEATTVALDEDIRRFIDLNNDLAIRMFKHVTSELDKRRSVALSPFGATSLLAMVFLGARGQTSAQMNDFLPLDDMITFNPHLVIRNITDSVIMSPDLQAAAIVRQLYSQESKGKLLDFYKARAGAFYDGLVQEVEFEEVSDVVRQRTNELVRTQTSERVPDFLSNTAMLRLRAPLAALSANVFQMNCKLASSQGRNSELQFSGERPGVFHTVPSTVWTGQFLVGYDTGLDATAVEIPHSTSPGGALTSTVFVMPGRPGSRGGTPLLARLEARLISRRAWSGLLRNLVRAKSVVDIQLPRFEHRSVLNLTVPLRRMGLKDLFTQGVADLRGINGIQDLYLTDIMQVNAFSACSDASAEGHIETYPTSRRTGRVGGRGGEDEEEDERDWRGHQNLPLALRPRQARIPTTTDVPRLRLDRPFLYFVRHNPTGMILHMGRFNPRFNS